MYHIEGQNTVYKLVLILFNGKMTNRIFESMVSLKMVNTQSAKWMS